MGNVKEARNYEIKEPRCTDEPNMIIIHLGNTVS